jgi:hypothetical protein
MNAVLIRNPNPRGRYPVTYIESDEMSGDSFSELRADVRNLQVHVAYLKAGVDTANTGIEFLREKLEQYRFEGVTRGEAARLETKAEFGALRAEMATGLKEVRAEVGALRAETTAEFKAMRTEVGAEFDKVRGEISKSRDYAQGRFDSLQGQIVNTQRWAIGLYAALFLAIAHGFKWF